MKFIEHSNSVYRSNKKYITPKKKRIRRLFIEIGLFIVLMITVMGIVYEAVEKNKAMASLKSSHKLGSYEQYKLAYAVSGSGSINVLFEPDIGDTLLKWNKVIKKSIPSVRMFYYDRFGYGGSDSVKGDLEVSLQSDALHNVIKNTGYSGKEILVSEGYGSLIHLDYYKDYPENVAGMIIIDPIFNLNNKSINYLNMIIEKISLKSKQVFSVFSILRVLDKVSLYNDDLINFYRDEVESRNKDNYISMMFTPTYFSTMYKENLSMRQYIKNLENFNFKVDVPVIIISPTSNKDSNYEEILNNYFTNFEVLYFEEVDRFSYNNAEYLRSLISNMALRVNK